MAHLLGYARGSTREQSADLQRDALEAAGCYRTFVDHASGKLDARPEPAKALDQLRPGDTLVVWRLDRLGRSLRHLIEVVTALDERGVGFRSLTARVDTTTPGGKLVFHLFGALAGFEAALTRERTLAGLAAARARGRKGGRRPAMTPEQATLARRLHAEREKTVAEIAKLLGVGRTTLYRYLEPDAAPAGSTPAVVPRRAGSRRATASPPPGPGGARAASLPS